MEEQTTPFEEAVDQALEIHGSEDQTSEEQFEQLENALSEAYKMYRSNFSVSLWLQDNGEYPVISVGLTDNIVFNSRTGRTDGQLTLSDSFFSTVGFAFHEAMSLMPHLYFGEGLGVSLDEENNMTPTLEFDDENDRVYGVESPNNMSFENTVKREYDTDEVRGDDVFEVLIAHTFVQNAIFEDRNVIPELYPLTVWMSEHTEFGCPGLPKYDEAEEYMEAHLEETQR